MTAHPYGFTVKGSPKDRQARPPGTGPEQRTAGMSPCAQMPTGFNGQHNPSHHRGPAATDAMSGMHH